MDIKTKFSLGDKVYYVQSYCRDILNKCETCEGQGNIHIKNDTFNCPAYCNKGFYLSSEPEKWHIVGQSTVGKINVELYYDSHRPSYGKDEIRYMLLATGVGSGTMHSEKNLFASKHEAQAECDVRNAIPKE